MYAGILVCWGVIGSSKGEEHSAAQNTTTLFTVKTNTNTKTNIKKIQMQTQIKHKYNDKYKDK